jgi:Divergent InlB B-repeat domain
MQFIRPAALLAACWALALSACGGGGGSDNSAADAQLVVTVIGPTTPVPTAQGRVTSQPAGIDCGSSCSATFGIDTVVTLTAAAPAGQQFSAWSGACGGSTPTCNVTLSAASSVTAAFIAASSGGGWSDQAEVSAPAPGAAPRVGIDAAGNATAIWLQDDAGTRRRSVWTSRRNAGGTWSAPAQLESSDIDFFEAELAVDAASGRAVAAWRGGTAQEVYARLADSAGVWGAVTRISGEANNINSLQVGIDASGRAVAVWTQNQPGPLNPINLWANRYSSAAGWGSAQRVAPDSGQLDLDPALSVSAGGRAFVVWTRNSVGILASHAEAGGAWSAPTTLAAGQVSTGVGTPRVIADANGNAMAVWPQGALNASKQFVTHLTSKRFANGAWSGTAVPLYSPVVTPTGTRLVETRLAANGAGQTAAVWSLRDGSVHAAQSSTAGVWSTAAVVRPASSLELGGLPEIAIDSLGNMFATWAARSDTPAGTPEVWLNGFATGSGWGQAAVHQTGADVAGDPRIAMNDRGNAAMVWIRSGSDGSRVISRSFTSGR